MTYKDNEQKEEKAFIKIPVVIASASLAACEENEENKYIVLKAFEAFLEKQFHGKETELTGLAKAFYLLFNEITELNESLDEIYD